MDSLEDELIKANLYFERFDSEAQKILSTNLDKAQKEILTLVANTTNKAKINSEVSRIMSEVFYNMPNEVVKDMIEISEVSYTATNSIMQGFVTAELAKKALDFKDVKEETIKRLNSPSNLIQGHSLQKHFKHLDETNTHKLQGIILKGFKDGVGIDEINRNVKSSIANIDRNQARTIIRTSILEASRASQYDMLDNYDDEITEYYYNGVLDTRTTARCWTLTTNNTTSKNRADIEKLLDYHYNCRSILGIRTDISDEFEIKRNIIQQEGKTVNHRDGTKSTKFKVDGIRKAKLQDLTPKKAFEMLDENYQKQYMGNGRYELWKSGKAKFEDMIDLSRNDFIPLYQLKQRLNIK